MFVNIYIALALAADAVICALGGVLKSAVDIWKPIIYFLCLFFGLVALHIIVTLIISLFINKKKECQRPNKLCRYWVYRTIEMVLDLARVRIIVTGGDMIPTDRRFLLVSNHRSNIDPLICIVKLYINEISFVSKPENFKIPIVGAFAHKCCYLPIDRENARKAMKTIHRATDFVKSDITSVGIYPEGTRSKNGKMLEFKDGVFYICKKAPCPVVVTTVQNTEKI